MNFIEELNEEQKKPVQDTEGALLVTAGAGSGKTRLLTYRIAYLVKEKQVSPHNILAITFTNKAANEMKDRVEKMLGDSSCMWISTFHSLCVKILRRDIDKLGYTKSFSIYADEEKNKILKDIFKILEIDEEVDKKKIKSHIARAKNNNLSPEEYKAEVLGDLLEEKINLVYEMYEEKLKKSNALDFDDLLIKSFVLLKSYPEVLEYYQNIFKYIHIDEFQDTNKVQYEIVKMLAGKYKNILVVGDEDQCIYGWRGANIDNIKSFQQDFNPVRIYKLEQNYRSTKNIINTANNVIKNNLSRIDKKLWTQNEVGENVSYQSFGTDKEEANFVVKTISKLVREEGYSKSDIAILMRLNALSRDFEDGLNNAGISYKVLGGFKFYERSEIKNIVAYLRILMNPYDEESLLRIINFPKRNIGDAAIKKLKEIAPNTNLLDVVLNITQYPVTAGVMNKFLPFSELYKNLKAKIDMPVYDFVKFLIQEANIKSAYNQFDEEDYDKLLNIDQFVDAVKEYQKLNEKATLDEYLQSVMLLTDLDSINLEDNSVLVSTIHAVKGLEFKIVFIIGLEEGIFPIVRMDERTNTEEERRLMYVGITRAKEMLFLTNCKFRNIWNRTQYQKPSRFLDEAQFEGEKQVESEEKKAYSGNYNSYFQKMQKDAIKTQKADYSQYTKGTKVFHSTFGVGEITDDSMLKTNHCVVVTFNILGAKTLSLEYSPLKIMKK